MHSQATCGHLPPDPSSKPQYFVVLHANDLSACLSAGRERAASVAPAEAGRGPRADVDAGGVDLQDQHADQHDRAQPEVLPHAREPQLLDGQEHGEADLELQPDRERDDGRHGRAAGLRRQVLLPGGEEGVRVSWGG